jgi:hypothetical protein
VARLLLYPSIDENTPKQREDGENHTCRDVKNGRPEFTHTDHRGAIAYAGEVEIITSAPSVLGHRGKRTSN